MQAKLYQITPYNLTDNNFYNFSNYQNFNNFIDKIETPIEKEVAIVKLESYSKIMYKIKFDNTKENQETLYCGIKYMMVDDKYWFITNFDVKKNNNQGFITYYAQLDHWATQWLTVKKHLQEQNKNKGLYVERIHQTRFIYNKIKKILYVNFKKDSPYHLEEKININNYIPNKEIGLKSDTLSDLSNVNYYINKTNRCFYFLKIQLKKPLYIYWNKKNDKDFVLNNIFIILDKENIYYYLNQFNPSFMKVFSIIDYKYLDYNFFSDKDTFNKDLISALPINFNVKLGDKFIFDIDFYKSDVFSGLTETVNIEKIDFLIINFFNLKRDINNEMIFFVYPYSKYLFLKGNSFKEYKINELLYEYYIDDERVIDIKMKYLSFISDNIYNLWIYPFCGIYNNSWSNFKKYNRTSQYINYGLNIINNLEIPTTSNSYTTYAQSNLNSLQTNINQAEQTRIIANQQSTISWISNAVTTALGLALAPVSFGASMGLSAVGAASFGVQTNKWVNNNIKNDFPVDSLNAKISDMKNTPNMISSTNNDYSWLTYFNNNGLYETDKNGNLIDNYSISRFLISKIPEYDKNILFDWYYFNGYLYNRYLNNINFDEKRNRYIFNFYKIKEIKTLLSSCPEICNEDIEWWNNTFNQGIIVWETEDPLKLYDEVIYIGNNKYENWEVELLNKEDKFILNKIKENKGDL